MVHVMSSFFFKRCSFESADFPWYKMMMSSRWRYSFANGTFVMIFGTMFFANLNPEKLWGKYISFVLVSCCMDSWKKSVDLTPERNWSPFKRCAWNPKQPFINGCDNWMVPKSLQRKWLFNQTFLKTSCPGGNKPLGKPIRSLSGVTYPSGCRDSHRGGAETVGG